MLVKVKSFSFPLNWSVKSHPELVFKSRSNFPETLLSLKRKTWLNFYQMTTVLIAPLFHWMESGCSRGGKKKKIINHSVMWYAEAVFHLQSRGSFSFKNFFFFLPAAASTSLSARFFARRLDPLEMAVFLSPGERLKGISKSGGGGVGEARWRAPK